MTSSDNHPLAAVLRDAAYGRFPPFDSRVEVMPALDGIEAALFGFSGHTIITTDLDPHEIFDHIPGDDPGAPMNPTFIAWLAERLDARSYTPDAVLVAFRAEPGAPTALVERPDLLDHPRAVMAQRYRRSVRTYSGAEGDGLVTLGRGICDRLEVSVEVDPLLRNRGLGRKLAYAARTLIPGNEAVFAEVSPGNAASLRAFLAAGYVPIGAQVVLKGAVRETD
jgi:GNAT superfamily N-acetyltransferase